MTVGERLLGGAAAVWLATGMGLAPDMAWAEVGLPIVNRSGMTIMEVYTSPMGVERWGDDLLHVRVVPDGGTGLLPLSGEEAVCRYDLRLVLEDGREVLGTADLCSRRGFTLLPRLP